MQYEYSKFTQAIISDYQHSSRIVNESDNVASLFYILITKEFRRNLRLHTIISNLSGAGKTTLADAAVAPFENVANQEILRIERFTGAGLERFNQCFDGKILYHSQAIGDEPTALRPLLSEGNLGLLAVERDEKSGKMTTKEFHLEGMPVFLSTSTNQSLDPELMRRVIQRTADESPRQTRAILEQKAKEDSEIEEINLGGFAFVESIIRKIKEPTEIASVSSTIEKVIVPYANEIQLKIPESALEMRSNFPKFSKLIKSIALVKSACFRGFYKIGSQIVAIANYEDFSDALKMAGESFFEPLTSAQKTLLGYLESQITSDAVGHEDFKVMSTKELQHQLGWSSQQIWHTTKSLAEKGLINKEVVEESGRKRNLVSFLKHALEINDFQIEESSPEKWLNGKSYELICIEDPLDF